MEFAEIEELWNKILEVIKKELSPQAYNSWFSQTKIVKFGENELIISAPGDFCKDWLEKHYTGFIKDIFKRTLGSDNNLKIEFRAANQNFSAPARSTPHPKKNIKKTEPFLKDNKLTLTPKYTFDNFVVGDDNRFAHAACLAVAQSPSKSYNPLFIYGGVGLGKTHLMQAIGRYIKEHNNKIKVLYISSEKFTNEMIDSIRDDRTVAFRDKYRSVDILLIDDIQFLAGKERTQEEFFHTFNTLYDSNKQIVITSDRPPKDIPTLENRLISRFEWGLITDIQPPDFETRIAILRKKAQSENLNVPAEVIDFIAEKIPSNIRQLEGALTKLVAFSTFTKKELSVSLAQNILKDIIPLENKKVSINQIQKTVSDYYNIKVNSLLSKKRTKDVVLARQVAIYLSRELTDLSLTSIGEVFGRRDHTTIIHSYIKIKNKIKKDKGFKNIIDNLTLDIKKS
ncbi:MAG TPA: chromosomal replication initiator protein DnaA [Candidatus Atribacteria bacterium]|nr:MAG: Chromosomal replication initiator protein DnaA [Atribacteria bacterium 34_128]HAJ33128.1 chromosomal replication initiator protein DnaA [Candidatus Atribacteria bacterium]